MFCPEHDSGTAYSSPKHGSVDLGSLSGPTKTCLCPRAEAPLQSFGAHRQTFTSRKTFDFLVFSAAAGKRKAEEVASK